MTQEAASASPGHGAADCLGVEAGAWGPRRAWERLGRGLDMARAGPDG